MHPTTPIAIFRSIHSNRNLILNMTRREIKKKYQGTFLGLAWSFISPLLMLLVYTFVFTVVFKSRWGNSNGEENQFEFVVTLFAGLIVFNLFSELLNQSPLLIVNNVNYVKRVVFPLEVLSIILAGSALFNALVNVIVLLIMQLILRGQIPVTVVFFPVVFLPVLLLGLGASWFFSSLGVYIRDIGQILGFLTTILLFTSAVFFPVSAIPQNYQQLLKLNPLVVLIEEARNVLVYGIFPNWIALLFLSVLSSLVAWIGFWWFQKARKGFADVL